MTVHRTEIGLVSEHDDIIGFYRDTFGMRELEPRSFPSGVVHRLGYNESLVKIMIPATSPRVVDQSGEPFWASTGLRFFTFWVDDLDAVLEQVRPRGGVVETGPLDLRPGVRTAVLRDPLGNSIEVMEDRS